MNKEEFIGKLQMIYVGDRNASTDIIEEYDRLKGALQTHEILLKTNVEENKRLNNIIDTILEFNFFKEECPLNFGFGDEKEEKAQDVFFKDDYCEENCDDIYKKCWLKYFEKLQKLKENK